MSREKNLYHGTLDTGGKCVFSFGLNDDGVHTELHKEVS